MKNPEDYFELDYDNYYKILGALEAGRYYKSLNNTQKNAVVLAMRKYEKKRRSAKTKIPITKQSSFCFLCLQTRAWQTRVLKKTNRFAKSKVCKKE